MAASIKSVSRPDDRLDPDYIAQCILSHKGRAQAPSREAAPQIKTWQERIKHSPDVESFAAIDAAKEAEIADLRAALAHQGTPQALASEKGEGDGQG